MRSYGTGSFYHSQYASVRSLPSLRMIWLTTIVVSALYHNESIVSCFAPVAVVVEVAPSTTMMVGGTTGDRSVNPRLASLSPSSLHDGRTDNHNHKNKNDGMDDGGYNRGVDESTTMMKPNMDWDLRSLGWQPHFEAQMPSTFTISDQKQTTVHPVRVLEVLSKSLRVIGSNGMDRIVSIPRGTNPNPSTSNIDNNNNNNQNSSSSPTSQPTLPPNERRRYVVGDWILLNNHTHRPTQILRRKNLVKRRAPGKDRKIQPMASNLDTVFVVSSCNQDFNKARLERYVAMALEAGVDPVVVLTKSDLCDGVRSSRKEENGTHSSNNDEEEEKGDDNNNDPSSLVSIEDYIHEASTIVSSTNVPIVHIDARCSESTRTVLSPWLRPSHTVALLGSSGVGKSSLVNSLCGESVAKVADIHVDSGKGRHTTTQRQMRFVPVDRDGAYGGNGNDDEEEVNGDGSGSTGWCAVIDTPGMRELRLTDAGYGVDQVFGDLVDLATRCRFNDCRHQGEPGCAIQEAIRRGDVDPDRVDRWEKLVRDDLVGMNEMKERKNKMVTGSSSTKSNNKRKLVMEEEEEEMGRRRKPRIMKKKVNTKKKKKKKR